MKKEVSHLPSTNPQLINMANPYIMHIDLNSCFAIIEQQANRLLRGKPVGVAAYDTPRGFVLAASYEAKAKGIKLGVNVQQARSMCSGIVIMTPDPAKYREAHRLFKELMLEYTPDVAAKSIDEFVLNMESSPTYHQKCEGSDLSHNEVMLQIGREIKAKIKQRLGEWVTVNIGIATNRFLAKYGAGFDKPDGMTLIDHKNLREYYRCHGPRTCASFGVTMSSEAKGIDIPKAKQRKGQTKNSQESNSFSNPVRKQDGQCVECGGVKLVDLPGINTRYRARLRAAGIYTPMDFLNADMQKLKKQVFKSIVGYYWYLRLRGHEIDQHESNRTQIGHQHALKDKTTDLPKLEQILMKLCEKTGRRLRKNNLYATGIHLYVGFIGENPELDEPASFEHIYKMKSWHRGEKVGHRLYYTADIYKAAKKLLYTAEMSNKVKILSVNVYGLKDWDPEQLSIFDTVYSDSTADLKNNFPFREQETKKRISDSVDQINNRYGEFVITPALMLDMQGVVLDRIAFGQVRDV